MLGPDVGDRTLPGDSKPHAVGFPVPGASVCGKRRVDQKSGVATLTGSNDSQPSLASQTEAITPPSPRDCPSATVELPTGIPLHITFDGPTKLAPLEHYILRAEQASLGGNSPSRPHNRVFKRAAGAQQPTLRSDQENRIIIYPGYFNPPHHGHSSLLWHAFLSTDTRTIAVLIENMDTSSLCTKEATVKDGTAFQLTVYQRTQLWQDNILSRFAWSYPSEDADSVGEFWEELMKICAKDGFRVALPSLHGGDHLNTLQGGTGWGQGTIIGSDVGRSVHFVRGEYEDVRLSPACSKKWKKTASKQVHTEPASECMSCWPCWKLRAVYPEFFGEDLADDFLTTSGCISSILKTCHASQGTIWWAKRRDIDAYMLFIPGGRCYESEPSQDIFGDEWFPEIKNIDTEKSSLPSATEVQKHFFASNSKEAFRAGLESLIINPELRAIHVGMDERWMAVDDWKSQQSSATEIKDDFGLEMEMERKRPRRRASI